MLVDTKPKSGDCGLGSALFVRQKQRLMTKLDGERVTCANLVVTTLCNNGNAIVNQNFPANKAFWDEGGRSVEPMFWHRQRERPPLQELNPNNNRVASHSVPSNLPPLRVLRVLRRLLSRFLEILLLFLLHHFRQYMLSHMWRMTMVQMRMNLMNLRRNQTMIPIL